MSSELLIHSARQLITLRGPAGPRRGSSLLELGIIPDGAVILRDGVIQACGTSRQVMSLARTRRRDEIDASGKVVMPAFVDLETALVHAHPAGASLDRILGNYGNPDTEVFRAVLDDGARMVTDLSAQTLRRRVALIAGRMLRYGTGTAEARAGYRLGDNAAMKVLRAQTETETPLDLVSTMKLHLPSGEDAARWARRMCEDVLPLVERRRLAAFVDLETDDEALPEAVALEVLDAAAHFGFGVKVHSGFFSPVSAVPLAVRAGACSVGNLGRIAPAEIGRLAASSCIAVFNPGLALQTGLSHCAPGRALVDAGAIPALASGYHPELSPGYNMQLILLLACRFYRWRPEEAIVAATINNAHALRAEASIGSIESGKQADLLVLSVSDYREIAYYAGVNIVEKVVRKGCVVFDASAPSLIAA